MGEVDFDISRQGGDHFKKQNRARQSGDDRKARGIFEFGTTVGFSSFPTSICTELRPKSVGQSKNKFISLPEIQSMLTEFKLLRISQQSTEKTKIIHIFCCEKDWGGMERAVLFVKC
jgi:hypothetical protein